jgi:uncharacterized protein YecE (DUF72 family)
MKWLIGCSGYQYRNWKPEFYPETIPHRLWFEFYNQHFNTLELNTTFYSFPKIELLKRWYARSSNDFVFVVKAPQLITHYKKFVDVKSLMNDLYKVTSDGLKEKLGAILFQLPPNLQFTNEKLKQVLERLDKNFVNVLEFRHTSWWNDEVYEQLAKDKVVFCSISHPTLPDDLVLNTKVAYIRMHGRPRLYTSEYRKSTLKEIIETINHSKKVKSAFVFFNNDSIGAAHRNARQMREIAGLKKKGQVSLFDID